MEHDPLERRAPLRSDEKASGTSSSRKGLLDGSAPGNQLLVLGQDLGAAGKRERPRSIRPTTERSIHPMGVARARERPTRSWSIRSGPIRRRSIEPLLVGSGTIRLLSIIGTAIEG
jgi:hypothetical protein